MHSKAVKKPASLAKILLSQRQIGELFWTVFRLFAIILDNFGTYSLQSKAILKSLNLNTVSI